MKFINDINKKNKRSKVILIGKGPSIDNLDLKLLNSQLDYDIMAISDSCKIIKNPKFVIHYHIESVKRSKENLMRSQYVLCNYNFVIKHSKEFISQYFDINKVYFFKSRHIKMPAIQNKNFDVFPTDTLFNYSGSVVGCVNFLAGYMGYKEIRYIGFDGGVNPGEANYAKSIFYSRKVSKIKGCVIKYAESWNGTMEILKHYADVKFLPLDEYLKKD